ncbi:MAG: phosphoadenosine phosphosulfate reductase family protein [Candidatus Thermoplasmatota archaeon]
MGEIRLGKMHLRWCDECNVPVMEQAACGRCGAATREVKLTPPGDARPAFGHDIERARALLDAQFGPGCGEAVLPDGKLALLNKAPDIDRMDEVIVDGLVVGAMRFHLAKGDKFLLRPYSATALAPVASRGRVTVDEGAIVPIKEKKASTLAVGVLDADPSILPGDDVLVLDGSRNPVSVGTAKMSAEEMRRPGARGTAVKTRWVVDGTDARRLEAKATWADAVEANAEVLQRRVEEAKAFVQKTVRNNDLPVAVSYSGGKDSLATLLLVLDAGIRPSLLFIDTGLEFEETMRNVRETAERYGLDLVTESAGRTFWDNVWTFGPPAKDYRWCCKTCKLGPATRLIQQSFPGGVLSFIGQRAYESEQRARKGRVWRNPWTPNQLAASPIQKWTAMHVWLYLFSKGADANPLYARGIERIGCFMCPATDLSELRRARELGSEYGEWTRFLSEYAEKRGLPRAWLDYDLWRWRRLPDSVAQELGDLGEGLGPGPAREDEAPLELRTTAGYNPCVEGVSAEGVFSRPLDMERVANLLNIAGKVTTSPDLGIAETSGITVFREGPVMVRGKTEEQVRKRTALLREVVLRAMGCAGCGICVARCEDGAMRLEGRAVIDAGLCTHCGRCLGPCPVVKFRDDELDI